MVYLHFFVSYMLKLQLLLSHYKYEQGLAEFWWGIQGPNKNMNNNFMAVKN